jgi:hypothetical protein
LRNQKLNTLTWISCTATTLTGHWGQQVRFKPQLPFHQPFLRHNWQAYINLSGHMWIVTLRIDLYVPSRFSSPHTTLHCITHSEPPLTEVEKNLLPSMSSFLVLFIWAVADCLLYNI